MEEKYNLINEIYNDFFNNNPYDFIVDNLPVFYLLADSFKDGFPVGTYSTEYKDTHLTFQDVLDLAREIICSIDMEESIKNKYLKMFDEMLSKGIIDFCYETNDAYEDSQYVHIYKDNHITNLININRNFTYDDVRVLIHEFFHYTNGYSIKMNPTINHKMFTEFISIYFEFYAQKYIKEKYNLSSNDFNYNKRLISSKSRANKISLLGGSLIYFYKLGNISDTSYEFFKDNIYNLPKETFDMEINTIYDRFKEIKDDPEKLFEEYEDFILDIEYFMGTIFTIYLQDKVDIKKMIYFNDNINGIHDIYDLLDYIGIDIHKIKNDIEAKDFSFNYYQYFKDLIHDFVSENSLCISKENAL